MPKHAKMMKPKARGAARGMARGGMQAAGVGADIGDWIQNWLGFAGGGDIPAQIEDLVMNLVPSEQKQLVTDAVAALKKAIKSGDVELPADAPAMSVGGDIGKSVGEWLGDWVQNWLGFAKGGAVRHRGHSVFH